jgi:hypothetical protein
MAIKLQVRRGTAAQWAGAGVGNVVILLEGEIGLETDTGNIKIGDGTNVWNDLAYQFPYLTGNRNHAPEDTTTLVIDQTNDRVGIGTSSPLSKVHVEGTDPVIRFRDTAAAASTHSLISADNADGTLTISADATNNTGTSNVSKIQFVVDGTTTATVLPNAVGIGTAAPLAELHVESATPSIIIRDTDGGANTYGEISAGPVGQVVIAADPNNATASSSVLLTVDGATVVSATTSGATISGTCTATTFSGSGASLTAGSVPLASLANAGATTILGRSATGTGVRSDLAVGTVQTMLGLGTAAYEDTGYFCRAPVVDTSTTDITASSQTKTITASSLVVGTTYWFNGTIASGSSSSLIRLSSSAERTIIFAAQVSGAHATGTAASLPYLVSGSTTYNILTSVASGASIGNTFIAMMRVS